MKQHITKQDSEWLDELMFLKLGLDMATSERQYPLILASDRDNFKQQILGHFQTSVQEAVSNEIVSNKKLIKSIKELTKMTDNQLKDSSKKQNK